MDISEAIDPTVSATKHLSVYFIMDSRATMLQASTCSSQIKQKKIKRKKEKKAIESAEQFCFGFHVFFCFIFLIFFVVFKKLNFEFFMYSVLLLQYKINCRESKKKTENKN